MNTNRIWIGFALIGFLVATAFNALLVAQDNSSKRKDSDDQPCTDQCTLQTGTGEPGWALVSVPEGTGVVTPEAAVVLTPPNGLYAPALPDSKWVGPTAGSGVDLSLPVGNYVYEFKFYLCHKKDEPKPMLSLLFLADNFTSSVSLNGGPSLISPTPFESFLIPPGPFSVVFKGGVKPHGIGTFRPCPEVNTLAITVDNGGGPTGLDAVLSVTGATGTDDGDASAKTRLEIGIDAFASCVIYL